MVDVPPKKNKNIQDSDLINKFIGFTNSINKYVTKELDYREFNFKRHARIADKNDGILSFRDLFINRNEYATFLLEHKNKLSSEIISYLGLEPEVTVINSDNNEILIKMEMILIMREFLRNIADINLIIDDFKIKKSLENKVNTSEVEFTREETSENDPWNDFLVQQNVRSLGYQYNYFIERMLKLQYFEVNLTRDLKLEFSNIQLIEAFQGVDIERIRQCRVCQRIFLAKRIDAWACSSSCRNSLKQNRWLEKKGPKKVRKRKDDDDIPVRFYRIRALE